MCLAVPGHLTRVLARDGLLEGVVDFGGVRKRVCLETLPGAEVGDWLLVHAGFAIQRLDEVAARELLAALAGEADAAEGAAS